MKILLLGVSPLPSKDSLVVMGPGIRTWQFTEPLLRQGHQVKLVCMQQEGLPTHIAPPPYKNLEYEEMTREEFLELSRLKKLEMEFEPDCIVSAAMTLTGYVAVGLNLQKPVWVDQFGDSIAEAQIKSFVEKHPASLLGYWRYQKLFLDLGDCFSAVSLRNCYSLLGQLGSRGRLNQYTVGYELVHEIPCGIDDRELSPKRNILSQHGITEEDFVVLWSGGYNTWTDVETLYKGLESAMAQCPKLHFVSTGGGIPHHSEKGYEWFEKMVKESCYQDRYHLLGWILHTELESVYQESHVALNCDRFCYETILGSRNRFLEWLKAGLPIVSTNLTELAQELEKNSLLVSFPVGDAEALAEVLANCYQKRGQNDWVEKRRSFVRERYSFDVTTQPLQKWVKNPHKAPDAMEWQNQKLEMDYFYSLESKYIRFLERKVGSQETVEDKDREIGRLHQELAKVVAQIHGYQREADAARHEKEKIMIQFQEKEGNVQALIGQLNGLNQEILQRDRTIGHAYEELHGIKQKLKEKEGEIKLLEHQLKQVKELIPILREELKNGRDDYSCHSEPRSGEESMGHP